MTDPIEIVRSFYREIWNKGRLEAIAAICHPDMIFRGSLGVHKNGSQGFADYVRQVRGALDNFRCDIEEAVAEDERVFAKMHFTGMHTGEFLGYPPTGLGVQWAGAALFHIDEGRIVDLWVLGDVHDLMMQLSTNAKRQSMPEDPSEAR